jgi:hypothetical protein
MSDAMPAITVGQEGGEVYVRSLRSAWPYACTTALVIAALCTAARAGGEAFVHFTGPLAGYDGATGQFADVKTPALTNTGTYATTWAVHFGDLGFPFDNYAGMLFDLKFDGAEISYLNLSLAGPHNSLTVQGVTGVFIGLSVQTPLSAQSTLSKLAVWHPSATNGGTSVSASSIMNLFRLNGYVRNTTAQNNSDIDITIVPYVIRHNQTSAMAVLGQSVWMYRTSLGGWAQPGQGTWVHVTTAVSTSLPASAFYAFGGTIVNTGGYGIEHMPEPASLLLLLGGAGAMVTGRLRRRRA